MEKFSLKNELIFLRHSKNIEAKKLFGDKETNASLVSQKKKFFYDIILEA